MTAKKVLFDTLNDLNSEELDKFKSLIELEEDFPPIPRSRLKVANTHDTVELLLDLYRDKCVEVAQRSLRRMNRTDLVQRLSDISSGTKEKQRPLLNQRVETMVFAIELLLETLTDLNDKEFKKFQTAVGQINPERSDLDQWIDMEDIVFFIVKTYGQQSVEMTKEVFKRIRRTDLVQRLSDSSSRPKKKHSVDKHLPTLIHKVATMSAVKELLPETLMDLSDEEFTKFKWLLPLTFFQRSLEITPWTRLRGIDEADGLVDVMMEKYGQQFVEMTEEILMDMKRTDLVQRLSETSSGLQAAGSSAEASGVRATEGEKHFVDEQWPAPIQKVETMVPVIELLLQTLADLSDQELEEFNSVLLSETDFDFSDISSMLLVIKDRQVTVFVMVQTHGQQSVETTKEVLKKIERTDLVQRLSDSSSGSKKRHLDEQQSALIHKIAAMATVKHVLLETLNDLSDEEIETFKEFLEWIIEQKSLKDMSSFFSLTENRAEMVDMMIETYSQQSVQLITEVLKKMNRTDLMQRLSMPSSGLKEKQSVDEHQPAGLEKAAEMSAVKKILLETLRGLGFKALEKFKTLLQFTYFQRGLPQISQRRLERALSAKSIVSLIVENQQPVEVTKEVFMDMNRTDLVTKLSVISSRLKDYDPTISVSSPRMDLMKYGFGVRAHCKVLIYKTTSPFFTLHVYLIPAHNPAVQQNLDMMELSCGHKKILKPHPEMPLKMRDCFILSTDVDGAKIFPPEMNLIYECKHPVSFEVIIKNADSDFRLMLTSKQEHRTVWTCEIRKDDYQSSTGSLQEECQSELIRKEATMTLLMETLLETLEELSFGELEEFKWLLQHISMEDDLPKISRQRMEMADTGEIVKLMVERYGQQCVVKTREVFMRMKRTDLVEMLSEISSESKGYQGSSGRSELMVCGSMTQDSSDWTKLEPEVTSTDEDEAPTYSLQSKTGNFECSVSGLRWVCKEKVSFKYQFCSLDVPMMRLEMMQYMPAGPLMNITVIAGKFDEVYLPHWICIDDNPTILDKFAVLHIDDCGDAVEKVSEVTSSHVKLSEPVFSLKMVLVKYFGLSVEIYCKVLIYYKMINAASSRMSLTLHVYLIPPDRGLHQHLDKTEMSDGYKEIRKIKPQKPLKMHDWFKLTTDLDGADIYPKGEEPQTIMLRYNSTDPDFYEVIKKNPDKDFKLTLTPKNGHQPVWTCEIQEGEYQNTGQSQAAVSPWPCAGATVRETVTQSSKPGPNQKKRSLDQQQKAAITADGGKGLLLKMLKDLKTEELKEFKWHLPYIAESQLENSDRVDIVKLMLQTYTQNSVEVAKEILEEIGRNDLVQMLSDYSAGSEAAGSSS